MSSPGIVLVANKAACLNDLSASLMPLPELESALQSAIGSELPLFVVLSASNHLWETRLDELQIPWGVCPDAKQGIDHCAAFGIHNNQDWSGWLIDMARSPGPCSDTYKALAGSITQFPVASAQNNAGHRDYPIAFQSRFGFNLMNPDNRLVSAALVDNHNDTLDGKCKPPLSWLNMSLVHTVDHL
ncbi:MULTISPECIES: hypothetical protein [unclassified Oceanobacter]|jgi:molybdenum cofactor cytidylyltransferase|nr:MULTISPECIES: hypothetical protein [unclassified Oceanobacter]MDP2506489.1 hypothetical protein [Oceanobacter sp. 3_MG-2023]MDP2548867.1 hypothetical protein [Oceanobacter sp. 4_MG-2023]